MRTWCGCNLNTHRRTNYSAMTASACTSRESPDRLDRLSRAFMALIERTDRAGLESTPSTTIEFTDCPGLYGTVQAYSQSVSSSVFGQVGVYSGRQPQMVLRPGICCCPFQAGSKATLWHGRIHCSSHDRQTGCPSGSRLLPARHRVQHSEV